MDIIQQIISSATAGFYGAIAAGGFLCGLAVLWFWFQITSLLIESFIDFWRS